MNLLRPSLKNLVGKKDLVGVEIGVFLGKNSLKILNNLDIKKLYLIDPYEKGVRFKNIGCVDGVEIKKHALKKLDSYNNKIIWIEDISNNVVYYIEDELDFVYVDGDHTYDGVIKDLNNFYKLIKIGGLIGGHDFDKETAGNQVRRAVYDFFKPLNKQVYSDSDPDDSKTMDWWVFK